MIGGIWTLFERAESVSSERAKAALTAWLKNLHTRDIDANWPHTFANIFDQVFGERYLSLKCFFRSSLASLIVVATFSLLAYDWKLPWSLLILIAPISFIPNYLSLLETRFVLRWMTKNPSAGKNLLGLAIDAVATMVIAVGFAFLSDKFWLRIVELTGLIYKFGILAMIVSNFLIASVLFSSAWTSVWLWLYTLSGFVVKILQYLGVLADQLKLFLDIDSKPIRSLGFVSMILITMGYLIGALLLLVA